MSHDCYADINVHVENLESIEELLVEIRDFLKIIVEANNNHRHHNESDTDDPDHRT